MKYMTIATIIAGISGFVVVILAARAFGTDTTLTTEFAAYWGLFFAATGFLTGITQETTRAVAAAKKHGTLSPGSSSAATPLARPIVIAAWLGLITTILAAASGPLWVGRIVSDSAGIAVGLMALGLGSYAIQAAVAGLLSGAGLWSRYAVLITLDTASRMILAIVAWLFGWKLIAFLVITVLGAGSWLILVLLSAPVRASLQLNADVPTRQFLTRLGYAIAASGASAILITGFPTLVQLTHGADSHAAVSTAVVVYAVTLTRAPILVPLQQFLSAIIVRFVHHATHPRRALIQPLALIWLVGIVGAAAAWLIGPWLMVTILGPSYTTPALLLALLTLGAACTASLMVTGAATMAVEQHRVYLLGWITATIVATLILSSPLELSTASWLALTAGPIAGLTVHVGGLKAGASRS